MTVADEAQRPVPCRGSTAIIEQITFILIKLSTNKMYKEKKSLCRQVITENERLAMINLQSTYLKSLLYHVMSEPLYHAMSVSSYHNKYHTQVRRLYQ